MSHSEPLGSPLLKLSCSVRAFYYRNKGHLLRQAQGPPSEVSDLYRMAGREYMEAVKLYPMDDERYACEPLCYLDSNGTAYL